MASRKMEPAWVWTVCMLAAAMFTGTLPDMDTSRSKIIFTSLSELSPPRLMSPGPTWSFTRQPPGMAASTSWVQRAKAPSCMSSSARSPRYCGSISSRQGVPSRSRSRREKAFKYLSPTRWK